VIREIAREKRNIKRGTSIPNIVFFFMIIKKKGKKNPG